MDQTSASNLYDENDQYVHIPCVVVVVYSGLTSLSTMFQYITMVAGCDRELSARFYSVASLKYHAPDT